MEECREAGVHLHHPATALCITTDVRNELASVRIGYTDSSTETELPCARLLIAAGAWTPRVFESLFPSAPITIPISSLAGHSLVVRAASAPVLESAVDSKAADEDEKHCHAVYCGPLDNGLSPELYEREDGVIYLAGVNSSTIPLPSLATATESVEASLDQLKDVATQLIGDKIEVVRTGLCFRPITPRGTPIITRVADEQLGAGPTGDESLPGKPIKTRSGQEGGVFIAAGHGPWGISLSLGTGKVLAEMMQEKRLSADVRELGLL
jgi:glycine/D-amino acid oxidase-like deaminating enzyme